jgi:hypothetical protein
VKDNKIKLEIDSTSQWHDMIGPIGIYYIWMTGKQLRQHTHAYFIYLFSYLFINFCVVCVDVDDLYKESFSALLWWMFELRQRRTYVKMLDPNNESEYTYIKWGRDRLAELEYLMPYHWCRINIHLLQHACTTLLLTGPVHATWMFVYERWMKLGKGFMQTAKVPGETVMKNAMIHEWTIRKSLSTKEDLNKLLTPPLANFPEKRFIKLLGACKNIKLERQVNDRRCDYNLICNFLLSNDPALMIINEEFETAHPIQSKNGTLLIHNWNITDSSYTNIQLKMKQKFNDINVSREKINQLLLHPIDSVEEYLRMSVNDVIFCTDKHENKVSRVTRKFIFYRQPLEAQRLEKQKIAKETENDSAQKKSTVNTNGKIVAQIDKIYHVMIHDVCSLFKSYNILKVSNYKYMDVAHESQLPYVFPLSTAQSIETGMPIVHADDIFPVNIALWPSTITANTPTSFLVVHSDANVEKN